MDVRQVTAYPTSLLNILTRTLNPSAIPVQAPTASTEYLAYLTSDLPSHYGAYTALDTPCPQGPFVTAFASIAPNDCIFYRISPPVSRIDCMCTSYQSAMISAIESDSGPLLCGSGILADLAIASATQAVRDVCAWRQGPQTVYTQTGLVPASYASQLSMEKSQLSELIRTQSHSFVPTYTTITPIFFATVTSTAITTHTVSGSGYRYSSGDCGPYRSAVHGCGTTSATQTAAPANAGYDNGYFDASSNKGLSSGAKAGIAVGVAAFVALLLIGVMLLSRRYNRRRAAATAAGTADPAPQVAEQRSAWKGKGPATHAKGVQAEGQPRPIGMPRWG